MSNFMGLRFKEYFVTTDSGNRIDLLAQTKADALYTAAELLDAPVDSLNVFIRDEWDD